MQVRAMFKGGGRVVALTDDSLPSSTEVAVPSHATRTCATANFNLRTVPKYYNAVSPTCQYDPIIFQLSVCHPNLPKSWSILAAKVGG
jgi:hypothetical protein